MPGLGVPDELTVKIGRGRLAVEDQHDVMPEVAEVKGRGPGQTAEPEGAEEAHVQ